jgi:hypothetical protein
MWLPGSKAASSLSKWRLDLRGEVIYRAQI